MEKNERRQISPGLVGMEDIDFNKITWYIYTKYSFWHDERTIKYIIKGLKHFGYKLIKE